MNMKKIAVLSAALTLGLAANASCWWSWWFGGEQADKDLEGCQLGLASECKTLKGAQVSLLGNYVENMKNGAQVALGFNGAKQAHNGPQIAFINDADSAALQLGLICINRSGFLPVFVFFNFDSKMFGNGNK